MSKTWAEIRHFRPHEFDSPDLPGSGLMMDLGFISKLDEVREIVGEPLTINSGHRTPSHNATLVGSVDSSSHESGHGTDIQTRSSTLRYKVISAAFTVGFNRIGIGPTFVHLDDDPAKPPWVVWVYDSARRV